MSSSLTLLGMAAQQRMWRRDLELAKDPKPLALDDEEGRCRRPSRAIPAIDATATTTPPTLQGPMTRAFVLTSYY